MSDLARLLPRAGGRVLSCGRVVAQPPHTAAVRGEGCIKNTSFLPDPTHVRVARTRFLIFILKTCNRNMKDLRFVFLQQNKKCLRTPGQYEEIGCGHLTLLTSCVNIASVILFLTLSKHEFHLITYLCYIIRPIFKNNIFTENNKFDKFIIKTKYTKSRRLNMFIRSKLYWVGASFRKSWKCPSVWMLLSSLSFSAK